jgi:hypothetical protein
MEVVQLGKSSRNGKIHENHPIIHFYAFILFYIFLGLHHKWGIAWYFYVENGGKSSNGGELPLPSWIARGFFLHGKIHGRLESNCL